MPFLGTEALAARLNRYQLHTRYHTVFRNVYVRRGSTLTPVDKAVAAWLWSGRKATVVGLAVMQADRGCDFDFLVGRSERPDEEPETIFCGWVGGW